MSDSMSRSSDRLRSPGEGPRQARPTTPGDHRCRSTCSSSTTAAARSRTVRCRRWTSGRPRTWRRMWPFRITSASCWRRTASTSTRGGPAGGPRGGARGGGLRRPGCRPRQQRRPAPRNQPSGRRLVDDRRRVARARGRARGLRVLRARVWPEPPPRDPRAWVQTVATRRLVDARRSEAARHRREETTYAEPRAGGLVLTEEGDDTLFLLFCCCHSDLAPASQVALTLRAVGGLTTREIADAFYVPEATMAQRISRAERTLA